MATGPGPQGQASPRRRLHTHGRDINTGRSRPWKSEQGERKAVPSQQRLVVCVGAAIAGTFQAQAELRELTAPPATAPAQTQGAMSVTGTTAKLGWPRGLASAVHVSNQLVGALPPRFTWWPRPQSCSLGLASSCYHRGLPRFKVLGKNKSPGKKKQT